MTQIDFVLSESDRVEFIKYCFKQGCSVIPSLHYDSDKYIVATDIRQYEKYCKESPLLFITSNKFSTYPLEFDHFENEGRKKYFIKQRHGGPMIDFFSPVIGEFENNTVGPGYIGIYPYYYNDNKKFVPNKNLTDFYKLLTSYIKASCKRIKLTQRTFWIGNSTIDRAKKGEIKLLSISNNDLLTLA